MEEDAEERGMEAEALEAIFMEDFKVDDSDASLYTISLAPETDEAHVSAVLTVRCPADYPSASRPTFEIASTKGLSKQGGISLQLAAVAACEEACDGAVCVFEVAQALRDWLGENNFAGQADDSMYAAMMRRDADSKRGAGKAVEYEPTAGPESEAAKRMREERELEARRLERLRLGTPVTAETFEKWRVAFHAEMDAKAAAAKASEMEASKEKTVVVAKKGAGKPTGKELFLGGKALIDDPEADARAEAEAAAELEAAASGALNASLFDDDDADLDDVDFDDDDDEGETDDDA